MKRYCFLKTRLGVIAVLLGICCMVGTCLPMLTSFAAEPSESEEMLSDAVMLQAMQIISAAEDRELTDSEIEKLKQFGLSDAQIEMLQSLSAVDEENMSSSYGEWSEQGEEAQKPLGLFLLLGVAIAAVLMGILVLGHYLFEKIGRDE